MADKTEISDVSLHPTAIKYITGELAEAIKSSSSWREVRDKLGASHYSTIKKWAIKINIETKHLNEVLSETT